MRFVSIVALLALAAPLPAIAATVSFSATGDPVTGTANSYMSGGVSYQTYEFLLTGFTPATIAQGDVIDYALTFTSPFFVPGGNDSQFIGVNFLEEVIDPNDPNSTTIQGIDGSSSGSITAFASPIGITAPKSAGCGNCITAIFDNSGSAFTISGLTGSLNVDALIGTHSVDRITFSYQIGNVVPAPVPEPASWAMLVGGFGAIGGAMRRRRHTVVRFV